MVRRDPTHALLGALLCLCGLAATGAVALILPTAQQRDSVTLHGFTSLSLTRAGGIAPHLAHLVDPGPYVVWAVALAAVALLRGLPRLALGLPLAMAGASASSELLKPLIAQPRFSDWLGGGVHVLAASWPSGHATAAMMVALGLVLVAPPALRPLAALLGAGLASGVAYSILVLGWHFPSDVLGGYLVAGIWTAVGVAILWGAERRWPARSGRAAAMRAGAWVLPAGLIALGLGGVVGVLGLKGRIAAAYAAGHLSLITGAGLIAVLAATLAGGLALALSDRRPAATAPPLRARHPLQG